ncbi:MAG TPA: hypothetical protein VMU07_00885 [Candidatus Paceibacterota bacterium]|nr:hypothetical protein [Candidatus Paceibacterota bacterium]
MIRNQEPTAVLTAIVIALASIGCLVFVIFARIQSVAVQNQEDAMASVEIAGWDTYSNDAYGFQVNYPPGWIVNDSGLGAGASMIAFGNPLSGTKVYPLDLFIDPNPNAFSSGAYVHNELARDRAIDTASGADKGLAPQQTPRFAKSLVLTVGSGTRYEAYELYDVFEFDRNAERIYVSHGTTTLEFDFPVAEENPNISLPVANNLIAHQIINTLVFVK